ncbi:acyltransferase family protein [Glycocaulis abyssi]|uniref:Acyltransferase family protein n=1 Tax=Glycocaulis abyssi TaxID=1433403 RepID=A0ABV9NDK0_9PROT
MDTYTQALFAPGHGRLEDQDNLFTPMRMAFAGIVLYAHALMMVLPWPVLGPWAQMVDFAGQHALNAFFVLSGYMILASLRASRAVLAYAINRVFRVFPLLIVVTLLTLMIVGPALSGIAPLDYLTRSESWAYALGVISQAHPTAALPFDASGLQAAQSANAPLWTVRYELIGYAGLGLLMLVGALRHAWVLPLALAAVIAGSVIHANTGYAGPHPEGVSAALRFATGFLIGAVLWDWRDRIGLSWALVLASICAAIVTAGTAFHQSFDILATAFLALRVGYLKVPATRIWQRIKGVEDLSYGIYIIHWPAGLMLMVLAGQIGWQPGTTSIAVLMTLISVALAWPLRVWVERPFQAWGRMIARGRWAVRVASAPAVEPPPFPRRTQAHQ